eukprot:2240250-Pleurochrysis_carterae.AAC.5
MDAVRSSRSHDCVERGVGEQRMESQAETETTDAETKVTSTGSEGGEAGGEWEERERATDFDALSTRPYV